MVIDSKVIRDNKYINLAHFYDEPFTLQMSKVFANYHLKVYGSPGVFYISADAKNYIIQCGEAIVFDGSMEEAFSYFLEICDVQGR